MHSSRMLREAARPAVVQNILGHANIGVTQNQGQGFNLGQSPKTNCLGEWRGIGCM